MGQKKRRVDDIMPFLKSNTCPICAKDKLREVEDLTERRDGKDKAECMHCGSVIYIENALTM